MSGSRRRDPGSFARLRRVLVAAALIVTGLPACGATGPYVWYKDLPAAARPTPTGEYLIGVGDTIAVRVYEQATLSSDVKIRQDGRIGLPFIGEIVAAGKTPTTLAKEIQGRLAQFIVNPNVTVNVAQSMPVVISVLGEVARQGSITLEPGTGVLQALAQAGGVTDFADRSKLFVLRRAPEYRRIRFTYDALVENQGGAATFPLLNGDVLVVE